MIISKEYLETVHKPKCYGVNPDDTCLCILKELCEENTAIKSDSVRSKT